MATKTAFVEKVFNGDYGVMKHIENGDGVPSHNAAKVGVLYWDYTNSNGYIATDTAGTWVKVNA